MPRIQVRLDDVESGFAVYPDDKYLVEIQESSKIKKSKESGNNMILWIGKILEGEYEGKKIAWNTVLTEDSLWNLKEMLEKVGLEWDEDGFELEDAFGKTLIVENEVRPYEGNDRNNVKKYYAADWSPEDAK